MGSEIYLTGWIRSTLHSPDQLDQRITNGIQWTRARVWMKMPQERKQVGSTHLWSAGAH